jgi:hypothetical protein
MNNKKAIITILTSLVTLFFGIKEFMDNRKLQKDLTVSTQNALNNQKKADSLLIIIKQLDVKNKKLIKQEEDLFSKIEEMEFSINKQKNTINLYKKNLNELEFKLNSQKKEILEFDSDYKNTDSELVNKIKKISN